MTQNKANQIPNPNSYNNIANLIKNYAIYTLDLKGNITSWNDGAANIKGWKKDEVLGKYYEFLFKPDDIKKGLPKKQLEAARKNQDYETEEYHVKKNGDHFLADITISQIKDRDTNKHIGYIRVVKDITKHRKQETDQKDANTLLRNEITRRKATEKALTDSNAELEAFASAASHDLQEPLRMVVSYLQLIDRRYRSKFDKDGKEFLEFAVDGANRMRELISDLADYARIDKLAKPFKPVDTDMIVSQVINNLLLSAKDAKVKVTTDELPTIYGDFVQLGQLFQNLIANAIKFCDKTPAQVHIACQKNDAEYVFSIKDNGRGINKKDFSQIFLIFKQLGSRVNRKGSGIGLATARKIVNRHNGRIWVESIEGKGSTFYFTIPINNSSKESADA